MSTPKPEPDQPRLHFWGNTPETDYYASQNIQSTSSFFISPTTNLRLFTRSWLPLPTSPIRALVFLIHGYGNDISWTFQATPIFLAQHNFACFALDLPSHGHSQSQNNLQAFIPDLNPVLHDCLTFFRSIQQNPDYQNLKSFLFGESMGAAISLLLHLKHQNQQNHNLFHGAILIAPMCRISDKLKPKFPIPQLLTFLSYFLPTLPIVPTSDLVEKSIKVEQKKVISRMNPLRYGGKPRLKTVVELLRATDELSSKLEEVRLPFLVLHGSGDVVTDPEVSRELYEKAKSVDKDIRVYDGMMHSLLYGETDENVEMVRNDLLQWLVQRCG